MSYTREGKCNRCGECCSKAVHTPRMFKNNNIINGELYCDLATFDGTEFSCEAIEYLKSAKGYALIGDMVKVTEEEKTGLRNTIDESHIHFFLQNCIDYPSADDPTHTPPLYYLEKECPNCAYKMVEDK